MAAQTQNHAAGTPACPPSPILVTEINPFDFFPSEGKYLFSVNEGFQASTAINIASCLLSAATTILNDFRESSFRNYDAIDGIEHLQKSAHALINAAISGIEKAVSVEEEGSGHEQ